MSEIIIDIDQTLYDFDSEVREEFFELAIERLDKSLLKGAYSTNMEWRNLTDVLGNEVALEAIGRVHDRTLKQHAFKGSVDTCCALAQKGHTIRYVTSRLKKYQEDTEEWLFQWGFPTGEVICSTHDKAEHFKDAQYLIDDRPRTIINFLYDPLYKPENGSERKAFGLWTSYNRNLTDIDNVYLAPTWNGIRFYLERKGLL